MPPGAYIATKETPSRQRRARLATELYTVSYLVLFSILGTLARLGLQWLTFYPGAPVVLGVLWANFAGTLFMGYLSEDQQLFRQEWGRSTKSTCYSQNEEEKAIRPHPTAKITHTKVKKTIPLYIGLTTGFCGSFTSFSAFIRDIFFALSNDLASPIDHPYAGSLPSITSTVPRNGGYGFMAVCAVVILTLSVCYSALKVGAHLAIYTERITPTIPFHFTRRIVDPAVAFIAWSAWLGAVFMAIWPPDRPGGPQSSGSWARETWRGQAIFACVFAPLGCLARFYASLKLNALIPSFPLGTFTVNIFGTAVLAMAYDLQHVQIDGAGVGGGRIGCQVLQGIMDGFCGCLTTVSTWILELDALKRRHGYMYGSASVLAGLAMMVVIMGSVRWTVRWAAEACVA
jgi:fluoride ion exporter CrcB/FEX